MEKKQSINNNQKNDGVSWGRVKCIGMGSFGTVNLAFNKSNGAVFAVKSVGFSSGGSSQIEALENEIRILQSVTSPYIIQYLNDDVSYESSTRYRNLHLEYLSGGTVADVAHGVDENTVRSYTWCIVSALDYLHSRGIVHCDVKGKNVLVTGSGQAKLADFGSAAEVKPGAPIAPRGSPLWMAPEVLRGESQGPESDVWSLGCTVIEMITGKPAWEDKGIDRLSRIGFSGSVPQIPVRLSELGRDFLSKCLKREPSKRWSCDQLLRHPFISSGSPIMVAESSPRCVLDWFSDYDENDHVETELNDEDWARDRIGKLAITGGVNWESEGWVVVRGSEKEQEGTSSVYSDLLMSSEAVETAGTRSECSDSVEVEVELRAEWEFRNSGGRDTSREECFGGGDKVGSGGLRCGSEKVRVAISYHRLCNLLLYYIFFTIFRYIVLFCWLFIVLLVLNSDVVPIILFYMLFFGLKFSGCHSYTSELKQIGIRKIKKKNKSGFLANCGSSDVEYARGKKHFVCLKICCSPSGGLF